MSNEIKLAEQEEVIVAPTENLGEDKQYHQIKQIATGITGYTNKVTNIEPYEFDNNTDRIIMVNEDVPIRTTPWEQEDGGNILRYKNGDTVELKRGEFYIVTESDKLGYYETKDPQFTRQGFILKENAKYIVTMTNDGPTITVRTQEETREELQGQGEDR